MKMMHLFTRMIPHDTIQGLNECMGVNEFESLLGQARCDWLTSRRTLVNVDVASFHPNTEALIYEP